MGFNEIGEIAVKSRYVSPGYWRKPELTKAKFIPDPDCEGKWIYLTGDMGYILPDGCLIHLGREDFQVKIRGYIVDVGEIESVLLNSEKIKDIAVVAREDNSGYQRLIAYVVPAINPSPTISGLRRILSEKLPAYMIPSSFVMLDSIPLNPNGKLDYGALPEPDTKRPELDTPLASARTPVEEKLANIWSQVLKIDEVGINDNFFDLGGHSLLVAQVISRVIKTFQIKLQ